MVCIEVLHHQMCNLSQLFRLIIRDTFVIDFRPQVSFGDNAMSSVIQIDLTQEVDIGVSRVIWMAYYNTVFMNEGLGAIQQAHWTNIANREPYLKIRNKRQFTVHRECKNIRESYTILLHWKRQFVTTVILIIEFTLLKHIPKLWGMCNEVLLYLNS